ncbi:3-ketoacyl-ACP reductase [Sulfodiicoccus acidiphilus]|uniref:3-ketoacyl-ACP reductase n=1 Tax=Sulfodiicoccus acidiphilus TaxID=1670455 RepID=A0A348B686_9CREN|nr:SDR family NAD(P)-dependent oxidoreductase [Sulfodiicoccus acidiphilus]BBD73688.1 3-ketoacyl-ACP reductase [Sulfodiicoccus acidiphilus]GGT97680.1 3-ketoacyl-ACP reductase [Sulfodiicoccus acidiphilus]
MRLQDRKVLVAGVSRGLGYSVAYLALKEGAYVTLNSRDERKLSQLKEELSSYGKVNTVQGDLSTPQGAKSVVEEATKLMGGLDHLVITVGGYVEDTIEDPSGLEEMLTNHVRVPVYLVKAASKYLREGSSIVAVSSMVALGVADPAQLSYAAAKTALVKLVEVLAAELLPRGVRVNGVAPSFIKGDFEPGREWRKMRKLGDDGAPPEDFASVVLWLLTDESEWVDGVVIPVDGGARLKKRGE